MQAYINSIALISPQLTYDGELLEDLVTNLSGIHFSCIEPAYKELINPVQLRRMSRILKMGLGASKICINNAKNKAIDAVVVGTGLACISDLEKFLTSVLDENEQALSPIPFINSSHNTVAAQIAMVNKITGYNNTYCHRGASFESALLDGLMLIKEGNSNVLAGGIDEYSQHYFDIFKPLYNWDTSITNIRLGEGSGFFLLGDKQDENTYAKLVDVHTFINPTNHEEVAATISKFLSKHDLSINDIDTVVLGKNGNSSTDSIYTFLENEYLNKHTSLLHFKHLCGEYMTATAFALWLAAIAIKQQNTPPCVIVSKDIDSKRPISKVLIYNHYNNINHSLILLENVGC